MSETLASQVLRGKGKSRKSENEKLGKDLKQKDPSCQQLTLERRHRATATAGLSLLDWGCAFKRDRLKTVGNTTGILA